MEYKLKKRHSPKTIGEKTQAMVIAKLIWNDIDVLLPFGDNKRYDFVIIYKNQFLKLQCKTARVRNNVIQLSLLSTRSNRNRTYRTNYKGQIDAFITFYENKLYLVPIKGIKQKRVLHLRLKKTKSGQIKRTVLASDFEFNKVLPTLVIT